MDEPNIENPQKILRIVLIVGAKESGATCNFEGNANAMEQLGMWRMIQDFADQSIKKTLYGDPNKPPSIGGAGTQTFTVHKN